LWGTTVKNGEKFDVEIKKVIWNNLEAENEMMDEGSANKFQHYGEERK